MTDRLYGVNEKGITEALRCPRCGAPVRLAAALDPDFTPTLEAACARPSLGPDATPCGGRKLADLSFRPGVERVQRVINMAEVLRRTRMALEVIADLRGCSTISFEERLAAAVHVAAEVLASGVPRGAPPPGEPSPSTSAEAAIGLVRGMIATGRAPEDEPLGVPEPAAEGAPETAIHKLYGYETEDEYYRAEFGGEGCPTCGKTLDASGRKHEDGSECL